MKLRDSVDWKFLVPPMQEDVAETLRQVREELAEFKVLAKDVSNAVHELRNHKGGQLQFAHTFDEDGEEKRSKLWDVTKRKALAQKRTTDLITEASKRATDKREATRAAASFDVADSLPSQQHSRFVISETHAARQLWDLVSAVLILYSLVVAPIDLAFRSYLHESAGTAATPRTHVSLASHNLPRAELRHAMPPCHTTPHLTRSLLSIPHLRCRGMLCYAAPRRATPRHAMPRRTMPCHALLAVLTGLEIATDTFFLLDVVLNCFTTYIDNGNEVWDLRRILRRYMSTWLCIDVVASIPFSFFSLVEGGSAESAEASGLKALKALKLFKIGRVFRLKKAVRAHAHAHVRGGPCTRMSTHIGAIRGHGMGSMKSLRVLSEPKFVFTHTPDRVRVRAQTQARVLEEHLPLSTPAGLFGLLGLILCQFLFWYADRLVAHGWPICLPTRP